MADLDDDDQGGLTIVMSPVQLAAVLGGYHLTPHEILMNRLWGGAMLVGSALQLVGGVALLAAPEPTMVTKVAGGVLTVHAADSGYAAARQIWTGEQTQDYTNMLGQAAAKQLGASDSNARLAGVGLDVAVPLGAGLLYGGARILAVRGGRISLAAQETVQGGPKLGHTILKHVGRTPAQLLERLKNSPGLDVASTFRDLDSAEQIISDALKANKVAIESWARVAKFGRTQEFFLTAKQGNSFGFGVVRATGSTVELSKMRVVLRLIPHDGKPFFILTAYPEL